MGRFSFTQTVTVDFNTGKDTGVAQWTAANGDTIFATVAGQGVATAPDLFSIMETFTITGGTGRFAGAQGRFTVNRIASGVTFMTSGLFNGFITSPGAAAH